MAKTSKKTSKSSRKTSTKAAKRIQPSSPAKAAKKRAAAKTAKKKTAKKAKAAVRGRMMTRAPAPPYKCQQTKDGCLKFYPDNNGEYNLPPGGERVDCNSCRYWF